MKPRPLALIALLTLAPIASANGAMGLGLEMWDLHYWFAYVIATVIAEAWLIGRWLGKSWLTSMGISILANACTGFCCAGGGFCAVGLHQPFVGSMINPNPFMNSIALLVGFAVPSALAEAVVWKITTREAKDWRLVGRSVLIHLLTVPVALLILLIPSHPYRGMEGWTSFHRGWLLFEARNAVGGYVQTVGRLPTATNPKSLFEQLKPFVEDSSLLQNKDDLIYGFYAPDYSRLSLGETWSRPFEINSAMSGKALVGDKPDEPDKWIWFVRPPAGASKYSSGIIIELHSGQVKTTRDQRELGY